MNRLQLELHRLYVRQGPEDAGGEAGEPGMIQAGGRVRAMVLELARPADWGAVSKVWQGVQTDLDLPAPAIAVSGTDGYQLWFSLLSPLPAPVAGDFLEALRLRYLGGIKVDRVSLLPAPDATSPPLIRHARPVPGPQEISGHWSAFVAPDLAPMFADEPWLDMPPNEDGQSRLLSRLKSILPADFQHALELLRSARTPQLPELALENSLTDGLGAGPLDPRAFLLGVMNDETVALGLRIEAAKALLHDTTGSGRR